MSHLLSLGRCWRKDNYSVGIMVVLCLLWGDSLDSHDQYRYISWSCDPSGLWSTYLSKNRQRERVGPSVVQRAGYLLIWDRGCMSLPKEILPKRISSAPGSLVLAEGFLEHFLEIDPWIFHRWRNVQAVCAAKG